MLSYRNVEILDQPGYFGKKRTEIEQGYNAKYGINKWEECWLVREFILNFQEAVLLYDDAYYFYLRKRSNLIDFACSYRDCYDNDPSNVKDGLVHNEKAVPRHLQDVSVRRALVRLGVWFKGEELLQIRGPETNGHILMPGNVPFHMQDMISYHIVPAKWARLGSVEHFWQSNKVIVYRSHKPI